MNDLNVNDERVKNLLEYLVDRFTPMQPMRVGRGDRRRPNKSEKASHLLPGDPARVEILHLEVEPDTVYESTTCDRRLPQLSTAPSYKTILQFLHSHQNNSKDSEQHSMVSTPSSITKKSISRQHRIQKVNVVETTDTIQQNIFNIQFIHLSYTNIYI